MAEEAAPRKWHQHPLVRRLPLLLVAIGGIWLFRTRGAERELVWSLPKDVPGITQLEVQLRDADGDLVKRETLFVREGERDKTEKVKLSPGTYEAQVFLMREGQPTVSVKRRVVVREDDASVFVELAERR